MNIKTIEEKLCAQSDQDLEQEAHEAMNGIETLIRDGSYHDLTIKAPNGKDVVVDFKSAVSALIDLAISQRLNERRQAAIDAFMSKVSNLTSQIEELQSQIQ